MKKIAGIVSIISLLVPFAAFAADASAGVQINATDSSGKPVHVETSYEDDGTPVFHLESSGGASAGGGSEDAAEHAGTNTEAEDHMSATGTASISAHITGDAQDEHVKNVEDKGDEVDFDYEGHGKFLGIFDLGFTTKVHAKSAADGTVETSVELPWWSFLLSGTDEVRNAIRALFNASANTNASASAGTN